MLNNKKNISVLKKTLWFDRCLSILKPYFCRMVFWKILDFWQFWKFDLHRCVTRNCYSCFRRIQMINALLVGCILMSKSHIRIPFFMTSSNFVEKPKRTHIFYASATFLEALLCFWSNLQRINFWRNSHG